MELSEEEKKAIELLKKLQKKTPYIIWGDGTPYNKNNQIQTILNLIEKQQKEIEEKTTIIMAGAEKVKQLEKEIEELKSIASEFTNRNIEQFSIGEFNFKVKHFKDNYIHKDRIREKMREIMGYTFTTSEERYSQDYAYDRLKELLEDD